MKPDLHAFSCRNLKKGEKGGKECEIKPSSGGQNETS